MAYLDDAVQSVKFLYNDTAGEVEIHIPHFWNYTGISFSFLSSRLLPLLFHAILLLTVYQS